MKKLRLSTIIWAVLLLAAIGLIFKRLTTNDPAKAAGKSGPGPKGPTLVQVEVAGTDTLATSLTISGSLFASQSLELKSEISGRVVQHQLIEGQSVEKGTILARIAVDDLEARVKKLQANQTLAVNFEKRQKQLLEKGAISQQEYDQAFTSLASLNAEIAELETQIAKSVIKAPFSGFLGRRMIETGSMLTAGSMITTLISIDPIIVEFSLPAKYADRVKQGTTVSFNVDGLPQTFQAKITTIFKQIDLNTRTVVVRAEAVNGSGSLLPGAYATVKFPLSYKRSTMTLPTEAVTLDGNSARVWLVKGGKAEPKEVRTGTRTAGRLEIVEGVAVGDSVITLGIQLLKPGAAVKTPQSLEAASSK